MRHLVRCASIFVLLLVGPALATASEKENGKQIDSTWSYQPRTGPAVTFSGGRDLARYLA